MSCVSPYLLHPVRELYEVAPQLAPLYRWEIEWRGADGWDCEYVEARCEAEALMKGAENGCVPNYATGLRATRRERVEQRRAA